jgi:hypothetical protein
MSNGSGERYGAVRRVPLRHWDAAVAIALAAAVAFGAIDQSLGALGSPFLTAVSGMSALWLLVPFLAGAWQTGPRRAGVIVAAIRRAQPPGALDP